MTGVQTCALPIYDGIHVAQSYHDETKKVYSTPDDALKYTIDGVKIKDIITTVEIVHRGI